MRDADHLDGVAQAGFPQAADDVTDADLRWMNFGCITPVLYSHCVSPIVSSTVRQIGLWADFYDMPRLQTTAGGVVLVQSRFVVSGDAT